MTTEETGGRTWSTYEPGSPGRDGEPAAAEPERLPEQPAPRRRRPTPRPTRSPQLTPGRRRLRALILGGIPVVLVTVIGISIWAGSDRDGVPGLGAPDALSADGLDQLRADVRERSGGTEVFRAVIYPEYAVVDVPVDATSQREESLYWDGDLDEFGGKGTSTDTRIDLADVDADVMTDAVAEARSLVEDPTSYYVVIDGPSLGSPVDEGTTISAYASNEYDESVYVEVRLDGTEVRRYVDGKVS